MKRFMIVLFALFLLSLLLSTLVAGTALAADTWLITQVTKNNTDDEDPLVCEDRLVWTARGGSDAGADREIFTWAPGEEIVQTVNDAEDRTPRLWGQVITWSGQGGRDGGTDWEVFFWNTLGIFLQTENAVDDEDPDIGSDGLVWSAPGGSDGGTDLEIFAMGSTGGMFQLTRNDLDDSDPRISGSRVVWLGDIGPTVEVFTWTPAGGVRRLTTNADNEYDPKVWGDRVVWTGFGGSDGGSDLEVFTWTLPGGVQQLTVNDVDDDEPQVWEDRIVWITQGGGSDGGTDREIMTWTPATWTVQITTGDDEDYEPQVSGDRIVWASPVGTGEEPGSYLDNEIFTWTPAGGVVRVTKNWGLDCLPQIWDDTIVWSGMFGADGGDDLEIFTAVPVPAFSDVLATDPYNEAITRMRAVGVIDGYEAGGGWEFRPDQPVKRAQIAKMLSGVVGLDVREDLWPNPAVPFTDLGDDILPGGATGDSLYPHEYVVAAYLAGITHGTTATTFAPYDGITRAQLVTMVVRAMESLNPGDLEAPPDGFQCAIGDFDPLHGPNMRIAEYNGLLDGLVDYGPGWSAWAPATRAETAQILWNLLYGWL
jgi:hypothetical protein